jgi:hypothetical protein
MDSLHFPATTDPGTYWLQSDVAARNGNIKQGQYKGAY